MTFLGETYDVETLPKAAINFEPIQPGWYTAVIKEVKVKDTKSGNGQYLAIRYDIDGPTAINRVVYSNINIKNQNIKAEEIGRGQLSTLISSIGLSRVTDSDELLDGRLQIKIEIVKDDNYGDRNEVKGFKSVSIEQQSVSNKMTPPWSVTH